jgi:LysR family transcriptional activator of glutamate synthase operon
MNLSQLRYFKHLAEVLNYTRVARDLFITQPTLSSSIMSLERELGVKLFQRSGRSVSLTKQGETFYKHVCLSLRHLDDGISATQAGDATAVETLNLGTIFTIQDDYLPMLVNEFCADYGDSVIIKAYQDFTDNLIDKLDNSTLDVAFCGKRGNEPSIEFFPVTYRDLVLCVRKDHPLAARKSVSFKDLEGMDLLSYRRGTPIGESVHQLFDQNGVTNVMQVYSDDISMGSYVAYSTGNVGTIMLESLGMRLFTNIVPITIDEVPPHFYWIYLAYNKERVQSAAAEQFIEFAKAHPDTENKTFESRAHETDR